MSHATIAFGAIEDALGQSVLKAGRCPRGGWLTGGSGSWPRGDFSRPSWRGRASSAPDLWAPRMARRSCAGSS